MKVQARPEEEVFQALQQLCASHGYLHAIACLCFRDNTVGYDHTVTSDDLLEQFSPDSLIRTEISTIIGLACKVPLTTEHPSQATLLRYLEETELLLRELHESMQPDISKLFDLEKISDPKFNPFEKGEILRESIFYGGESAYRFQYRDLSLIKYRNDDDWFRKNKGYTIEEAVSLFSSLGQLQNRKLNACYLELMEKSPEEWTVLPAYTFSIEELAAEAEMSIKTTTAFVESFSISEPIDRNTFSSLDDFNPINAYPIIKLNEVYLLYQNYSLGCALYETPFFWFNDDKNYKVQARQNRGVYTESFAKERLERVFGRRRVFTNVDIYKGKKRVGEIDVLVAFANRAIVLQAKSKKLTILARKGNDDALQKDFKKAVQEANDQAFSCAQLLTQKDARLIGPDGVELTINRDYKEIFPFCVVSDHYPALSFQARQFLDYQTTQEIKPPFIMDVFFLDVATEMLNSPLHFLSYVKRRVEYEDRILAGHELTILAYHLKQNLWIQDDISMIQLADDIGVDLDLAMQARRDGMPGKTTPEGLLTKYEATVFGHMIREIGNLDDPATIDLGYMLLALDGGTIENINDGIGKICALSQRDNRNHDLTMAMGNGVDGITIHCNTDPVHIAGPRLEEHCARRKYTQKAQTWFGLCIEPQGRKIKLGLELSFPWERHDKMDELTINMDPPQKLEPGAGINFTVPKKKIGRNDKCPCGSGKKYKKCCLR